MTGFVQIIEFSTTRPDEIRRLVNEYRDKRMAEDRTGTQPRGVLVKDRERANTYVNIVEFPSYEEAMENSNRPDTSEFAAEMAKLCDGPPTFRNLDLVEEMKF